MSDDTNPPFNPNSSNAMFATILAKLDEQDRVAERILQGVTLTNGRVTKLEKWKTSVEAKVAAISLAVSTIAGVVGWYFGS